MVLKTQPPASSASVSVTERPQLGIRINYDTNGQQTGHRQTGRISSLPANVQEAIQREVPSPAHTDPTPEGWLHLAQEFPEYIVLSSDAVRGNPIRDIGSQPTIRPPDRGDISRWSSPTTTTQHGDEVQTNWSGATDS